MTLISLLPPIIVPSHPSGWQGVAMMGASLSIGKNRNHGIYCSFTGKNPINRDFRSNDPSNREDIEVTTKNISGRCRFH
jgi:hypothetical protein